MKSSLKEVCGYKIRSYVDKKQNVVSFSVFTVKVKFASCFGCIASLKQR